MPDLFGLDIKGIINDAFEGELVSGTLTEVAPGARNANVTAGRAKTNTPHPFTDGVIDSYTDEEIDGTSIKAGDRRILIIAGTLDAAVSPEANWTVTIEGGTYRVVKAHRDPAEATWTLQVRGE